MQQRNEDITPLVDSGFEIFVDEKRVNVSEGETVLSAMFAVGIRMIMKNDHEVTSGAYCGMGVCHCCHVTIDGKYKQRACKTQVKEGMQVKTRDNRFENIGIKS
jgi:hydrogen cyanide synthase HcnA